MRTSGVSHFIPRSVTVFALLLASASVSAQTYHTRIPAKTLKVSSVSTGTPSTTPPAPVTPTPTGPATSDGSSKTGACGNGDTSGCATWSGTASRGMTLSNGNLDAAGTGGNHAWANTTVCKSSGKWYVETTRLTQSAPANYYTIGINRAGASNSEGTGSEGYLYNNGAYDAAGNLVSPVSLDAVGTPTGIALDLSSAQRSVSFITNGGIAVIPLATTTTPVCIAVGYTHGAKTRLNAGQSNFSRAVPAGFNRGLW